MTSPNKTETTTTTTTTTTTPPPSGPDLAIIGYGYRLPGGIETDEQFWDLLCKRGYIQESVANRYGKGEVPYDGINDTPLRLASAYEGLYTDGKEQLFDCPLFGMSPADAKQMDPQIKLMLLCTWEALQHAGMDMNALHNSNTGCFIGHQASSASSWRGPYGATSSDIPGRSGSMIANRISFHFQWMGPSFGVTTACSSGITALDCAYKSLAVGECDIAAFGAVHYLGVVTQSIGFNNLGIISKTATSRSFSKDANGYMRGEGSFMYILKRLPDAQRDGDNVLAVIRGVALNCAGAELDADLLSAGRMIVAPVGHAQQTLMEQVAETAGVDAYEVDYMEAHATGTPVGDAIEGNAIANAYGGADRPTKLRMSSSRSNMGHMEAASFTLSLLKVIMMMQKKQFLPVSKHHTELNPNIPWEEKQLAVQLEVEPFPVRDAPVLMGINSFGFGGANGHCIVQEYKDAKEDDWSVEPLTRVVPEVNFVPQAKFYMVPFSAKSEEALVENAKRFVDAMDDLEKEMDFYTFVGNMSARWTHQRVRTSFVANTFAALKQEMAAFVQRHTDGKLEADEIAKVSLKSATSDPDVPSETTALQPTVMMLFPGQGSQWAGCGKELYDTNLVFRRVVDVIDAEWVKLGGSKLSELAFDKNAGDKLTQVGVAQPVTFLIQVALLEMLKSCGVHPNAVAGHSAGEAAAVYATGAYTLEEATRLVYHRSHLQEKLANTGRMLVLMMDKTDTLALIKKYGFTTEEGATGDNVVDLACFNSPGQTVICGPAETITKLQEKLEADGQPAGKLIPGNIAFHSRWTVPIRQELLDTLGPMGTKLTEIPFLSTVTGGFVPNIDAEYWWLNVRKPVNLLAATNVIREQIKPDVIIELSHHITLRSPTRDNYSATDASMPPYVFTLVRNLNPAESFAKCLGNIFKAGQLLDFKAMFPRPKPLTHLMPKYYLKLENMLNPLADKFAMLKMEMHSAGPLLGTHLQCDGLVFQSAHSKEHFPWMMDHVVQGNPLIPAAAYVECLCEAFEGQPIHIKRCSFFNPFVLDEPKYLNVELKPLQHNPDMFDFRLTSRVHGEKDVKSTLHCFGVVQRVNERMLPVVIPNSVPRHMSAQPGDYSDVIYPDAKSFYDTMSARIGEEFSYGPYFQCLKRVRRDPIRQRLRGEVEVDRQLWEAWDKEGYILHPSLLDGVLQIFLVYLHEISDFGGVPQSLLDFVFLKKPTTNKVVIYYDPPDYMRHDMHQKGQVAFGLGERSAGHIEIYDAATEELCFYVGDYTSWSTNKKKPEIKRCKHFISWQPKDGFNLDVVTPVVESLNANTPLEEVVPMLISNVMEKGHPKSPEIPFFLNAAECIVGNAPERFMLENVAGPIVDKPCQYTVLGSEKQTELLTDLYSRFNTSHKMAHMRFFHHAETEGPSYLRPKMFEFFIARVGPADPVPEGEESFDHSAELARLSKFVSPGGIMLVDSVVGAVTAPSGYTSLWEKTTPASEEGGSSTYTALLLAPPMVKDTILGKEATESEIVVDDTLGFSEAWRQGRPATGEPDFAKAASWTRVDYFAMQPDVDSDDNMDLFEPPAKLTEFVKNFASARTAQDAKCEPCVFTVYTSGAVKDVTSVAQGGIWGAIRSIALELSDTCMADFHIVDVKSKGDLAYVRGVETMRERELCVHDGHIFTVRLINHVVQMPTADLKADDPTPFRLETDNSGVIADLEFKTMRYPELGEDEVEIEVKGTALNFRDIMVGLGRLPLLSYERSPLGRRIGIECSGVVTKVGKNVTRVEVGQRVAGMTGGCVANRIRCHQYQAFPLPQNLSFEQGASVVSVYVTAYYALIHLANINENSTILVHSTMGGVGQAALALAKLKGAKVYGTAGSAKRRKALREMGCVDAFDSHSTDWFPDLMEATGGKGVDVVLNSLAGYHVDLCLEALCAGGYHCEIGKVDIFADRPIRLAVFRKNLKYCAIDIDRMMWDNPHLSVKCTEACLKLLEEGKVPVLPTTVYKYQDYNAAITCMMNGQHQGKLVLLPPGPDETIRVVDDRDLFGFSSKDGSPRTVLLTGCMGGFGLRVFAYVLAMGAKHIFVLDRDPQRKRDAKWLKLHSYIHFAMNGWRNDVKVHITYAEVANYDHCKRAVAECAEIGFPPIGSVFHLAGVLDDKYVQDIDRDSYAKVYAPKAQGAWNLHRATSGVELEHFVMVSSTSSTFGNPGQVNYSAANSFQDSLAEMRRTQGKHALSFCMGAVVEAGMASRNPALLRMMKANGLPAISCIFAMYCLDTAIRENKHTISVAAMQANLAAPVESNDFLRIHAQLVLNNAAFKLGKGASMSKEAIMGIVGEKVAKLCGVESVDPTEPLSSYGLNSISVAELIAFLKTDMGYSVSAMSLMTSATVEVISEGIIAANTKSDEKDEDAKETTKEVGKTTAVVEFDRTLFVRKPSKFDISLEDHFAATSRVREGFATDATTTTTKPTTVRKRTKAKGPSTKPEKEGHQLGAINGKLPPSCQETLDNLMKYMKSFDVSGIAPVTPVQEIKKIVLTGATGFVGRHFIALLLERPNTTIEKIYCPIRASNDEAAMKRLVEAMTGCNQWKESFRSKIHAFAGDMAEENLGASPELYQEILKADCVYHFAASLNLAAPWEEMRVANCLTMMPVFKLVLTEKKKHLFLGSTVGMFPQYFTMFANEMADKQIERDAMPDIRLMKQIFPLFVSGYVWTKLVNELVCYEMMRSKSVPLAVLRMPNMHSNGRSGMTTMDDPLACVVYAIMQTKMYPSDKSQARAFLSEDSNVCNELMLNITLNPDRKNVIYHCSRQSALIPRETPGLEMLGFNLKYTTYEEFKEACLAMGEKSALHGYWILVDHYANYWIRPKNYIDPYPIDDSTCVEDCLVMPPRPNALEMFKTQITWAQEHPDLAKVDTSLWESNLSMDSLIAPARALCEEYGVDFEKAVPSYVQEGLKRICDEVNPPFHARAHVANSIVTTLETRVNLCQLLEMHPEIKQEKIVAPVIILGLNRTGTTFLHRILVESGLFAGPHLEEQMYIPPAQKILNPDPEQEAKRLEFIQDGVRTLTESFEGIHETGVGYAEEDLCAHAGAFLSLSYDVEFDLPKYREWMDGQSLDEVYAEHKQWMQYISWSRARAGKRAPRWCFKMPWHARSLEALLKVYPDAVLVHNHRDVRDVAGSWFSLVESQRIRAYGSVDRAAMAAGQTEVLGNTLEAAMKFREAHPEHKEKWLDLQFADLIADPVAMANKVITHSGIEVMQSTTEVMQKYIADNLAKRGDAKLHTYALEDYDVDAVTFDSGVFAKYKAEHLA